jgi:hypothetical protein
VVVLASVLLAPDAYAVQTMATAHTGGDPNAGPSVARAIGGPGGGAGLPDGGRPNGGLPEGDRPDGGFPGGGLPGDGTGGSAGGLAGDGNPFTVDQELIDYLVAHRGIADWIVAADGSGAAASIQLAAGEPVMAMGGFTGGDPWPDATELASLVGAGRLRYVLVGRGVGGGFGAGTSSGVTSWVTTSCTAVTVGGTTGLYDCAP